MDGQMTIGLPPRDGDLKRAMRNFGLFMAGALPVFGGLLLFKKWIGATGFAVAAALGAAFLLAALVAPLSLRPVEKGWMRFGEKLGTVVTFLIMFLTFFLVVTPLGMLRRALGQDTLKRSFDRNLPTYWEPTEKDGPGTRFWVPY